MSIYIKGMEMPTAGTGKVIMIDSDGDVWAAGKDEYTIIAEAKAVPILPHRDLIDRDALMKGEGRYIISFGKEGIDVAEISHAPTIIPADGGAE